MCLIGYMLKGKRLLERVFSTHKSYGCCCYRSVTIKPYARISYICRKIQLWVLVSRSLCIVMGSNKQVVNFGGIFAVIFA